MTGSDHASAQALMVTAAVAAGLTLLTARGLLTPRQAAAALGGLACGAAIGWAWAEVGHG
ncbi:hypothetical protein [Brevundimonas sp.]|uniref:hypothetical protein n=1 Tax=Brevundimonas sp. TaxID=1871086 RepID=UPI003AFFFB1F